jgi:hypothetical protein
MTLIETKTLGTAQASIEFTSIPQDFTDLLVLVSLRGTTTEIYILTDIFFNGSTTGFSSRGLEGNGSSAVSYTNSTIYTNAGNGATSTANTFSSHSIYIPNYAGSTNKSVSVDAVLENNATTAYSSIQAGLWANTAAITSIQIKARANSFVADSAVSLYGITKGTDGIVTTS